MVLRSPSPIADHLRRLRKSLSPSKKRARALAIAADAANPDAIRAAVAATVDKFGGLDILVNNAGIAFAGPIDEIAFDDYQAMLAVNVTGVFVATQEAVRHMKDGGRIIQIGSSITKYAGVPGLSAYGLTKGAVAGFNRSLAHDLGPRGITVNTVHPGPTDTDMNPVDGEFAAMQISLIAVGRYGKPQEIASVVAFLASPEASFVTVPTSGPMVVSHPEICRSEMQNSLRRPHRFQRLTKQSTAQRGFDRCGCKTALDGRGLVRPKTTTLRRVCLNPKEISCLR